MTERRHRRIPIVGINYAPEHSGIAPCATGAAEYLAAQGDDVQVLTGIPYYPNGSVPSICAMARASLVDLSARSPLVCQARYCTE